MMSGPSEGGRERRPVWSYLLLAGLVVLGASAVFGGWSLVTDPTGGGLGLPYEWIRPTVFGDYLIPGIVLLLVLGLGSFVVLYGVLRRSIWAWPAGVTLGFATLIWLVVQVLVVQRFHPLQAFIAAIGLSFLVLLALPSMRRYYRANATLDRVSGGRP